MEKKIKIRNAIGIAIIAVVCLIVVSMLLFVVRYVVTYWPHNETPAQLEYRTDLEPLENKFPILADSPACYWKASTINASLFPGPTDIYYKGFVVLTEQAQQQIWDDYGWDFIEVSLQFEEGIDPHITGYEGFMWMRSREFTRSMIEGHFLGYLYVDFVNGVLYIDISTY